MRGFKKVLFWSLSPFTMSLYVVLLCISSVSEYLEEVLHKFEGWSFDYKDNWEYLGDGIWKGKD